MTVLNIDSIIQYKSLIASLTHCKRFWNSIKIIYISLGNCWKSPKSQDWRVGQEKILSSIWLNSWAILLFNKEKNTPQAWRCPLFLRKQCYSSNISYNGISLSRTPWRRFLPLYSLFWWECLWRSDNGTLNYVFKRPDLPIS